MRRAWASLLLAIFSFSLIAPALFAGQESDLPACCRRLGQHHCSLLFGNTGIPSVKGVCSNYTQRPSIAISPVNVAFSGASSATIAPVVRPAAPSVQPLRLFQASSELSRPKRGPPAVSL